MRRTKRFQSDDVLASFALLTRFPVPVDHELAGERAAQSVWAYPVVGAVLGGGAAIVADIALWFGVSGSLAAALAIGFLVLATGALHEDGIADCADGLGGGKDAESRLAIMKDSRIGAFGAAALGLVLLARWSGVEALITTENLFLPLVAVGAVSRLPMIAAMALMDSARSEGMAARIGQIPAESLGIALGLTALILIFCLGFAGLVLLFWVAAATLPLFWAAQKLIGGQSGDILGGAQQIAEIAALGAAFALLS